MDAVEEARRAHGLHDWPRAYDLYSRLDAEKELGPEDLSALADAAWWVGKLADCVAARQRTYEAYAAAGDRPRAALAAFSVSLHLGDIGDESMASGWRGRAQRLADELPDSLAAGYLLSMESAGAFHRGAVQECIEKAIETREIGERNSDLTLIAWAIHLEGLGLIKQGHVQTGWARLEESMVAAARGKLNPVWAGLIHCGMMLACEEYADPRRGWQWVETTERWLEGLPGAVLYPGVCRAHKVRLMQLRGSWIDAESEARRVCDDLLTVHGYTASRGYYEIAEIRRLMGDHDAAQELYKQAHELGWDPQPGLARLRLAQGRIAAAEAGIRRALDETIDPLVRASLLPPRIEVALAAGDIDGAKDAADELTGLAEDYDSPGMRACAATGRGTVMLALNDPQGALRELRPAIDAWIRLDCPYEIARARVVLGQAMRALGDEDGATLELEAARHSFERLGAAPDARRALEVLQGHVGSHLLSPREVEVLKLVSEGRSNKEIGARLFISENTVARHISNIFGKLGVASRTEATSVALKQGLA